VLQRQAIEIKGDYWMRKVLASGLAVFGMVSLPAEVSRQQTQYNPPADYRNDPRLHSIRAFFQRTDCPAVDYSSVFLEAADDYDLDWRLLPSLSFVESTGGKFAVNHNLFGWDSGRAEFPSDKAGIHSVGYQLAHSGLYKNKKLDAILAIYNPNAGYAQKVKSVMRRISPSE
jgi:hypothetical protein